MVKDDINLFLAFSNEGHVVIKDETMFEVLHVTGYISGTEIGVLPSKVNKVKKFADEEKNEAESPKM